jgi:hypothetical protein
MIFDHRSVHEISDEEIDCLVRDHVCERQHLEFKASVNLRDDEGRHELLRDIVSLANGGGGYLIIGIRDDGCGKAQTYNSNLELDIERTQRTVLDLSNQYISERLHGLEVVARCAESHPLVIVRVPNSERQPHMVTYNNATGFYRRYHDGKRTMTISEIREAFTQYSLGKSHDGRVFQESDEIINEGYLEILLMDELDDGSLDEQQKQVISDFYEFLKDGQNRYIHRDIRSACEALIDSLGQLLAFFDANYYELEGQGYGQLLICPDLWWRECETVEEHESQAELEKRLDELTLEILTKYQSYRRAIKSVLSM